MSVTLNQVNQLKVVDKVIIHSHSCSLYLVSVILNGEEHYVVDKHQKPIKATNKQELQSLFQTITVGSMVLRQDSAYDEMVGQPGQAGHNRLEVALGNTELAFDYKS